MEHAYCLNCGEQIQKKFCPDCGQKTDTHRIKLKDFMMHDMLHGIWHLERGILFTIKEAFIRPGQAALDYIKGKRIRYYNVFYLSLLIIGLNLLLSHFYEGFHPESGTETNQESLRVIEFFSDNIRFILLGIVPVLALNAFIVFRRLKLNLAEHCIIGGISLLGMVVISILFLFIKFLHGFESAPEFLLYIQIILVFVAILFPVWSYYNAVKGLYRFWGFLWRIMIFYILVFTTILVVLVTILLILTNGKGEIYL